MGLLDRYPVFVVTIELFTIFFMNTSKIHFECKQRAVDNSLKKHSRDTKVHKILFSGHKYQEYCYFNIVIGPPTIIKTFCEEKLEPKAVFRSPAVRC